MRPTKGQEVPSTNDREPNEKNERPLTDQPDIGIGQAPEEDEQPEPEAHPDEAGQQEEERNIGRPHGDDGM